MRTGTLNAKSHWTIYSAGLNSYRGSVCMPRPPEDVTYHFSRKEYCKFSCNKIYRSVNYFNQSCCRQGRIQPGCTGCTCTPLVSEYMFIVCSMLEAPECQRCILTVKLQNPGCTLNFKLQKLECILNVKLQNVGCTPNFKLQKLGSTMSCIII